MIVIPLIQKIAELFIILITSAMLVKTGILKSEDSKVLSKLSLYFVTPCVIFNSFQQELTPQIRQGLFTAVLLAVVFQTIYILFAALLKRVWHANEVERASIIFTNAGNLIIPIVAYVLGQEWVIYVSGYITVFNIICWTYGVRMFDSKSAFSLKKVLLNPNILAVLLGIITLFSGIRLSGPLEVAFDDVSGMIGPLSMMITGMVVGSMNLKDLTANKRVWGVLLFRMVITSGIAVLVAGLSGIAGRIPSGHEIVMISLLSAVAPSASNINQLAILYNHDAKYASAINVLTTLSCIATMPFWVMVFEMISR
ncbi:MAG: AEC family transporter [Lachnospiraceae bacterium]|nr:AEC family transporter [Lachnospiraceae bacterium]MBQ9613841.1 AEC family transporter [Lachnospiraceae bacterium]